MNKRSDSWTKLDDLSNNNLLSLTDTKNLSGCYEIRCNDLCHSSAFVGLNRVGVT